MKGFDTQVVCNYTYKTSQNYIETKKMLAKCGYNQDSKFYCPWGIEDPPVVELRQKIINSSFYRDANIACKDDIYYNDCYAVKTG